MVAGCELAATPEPAPVPVPPPQDMARRPPSAPVDAIVAAPPGCVDPAADAEHREAGVKPATWKLDLDGDGVIDPAFSGFCTMMGGNCTTYLYASSHGCARFVGQIEETEVESGPRCADPPHGGQPCRLSTSRMMIHGEIYEYFYTYAAATGYAESGVGVRSPAPPAY